MAKKKFSKSNVLWFIRTRPYTPVADLRRRFRLEAEEMAILSEPTGKIYIGLPEREANMIHQLWLEGKIGLEMSPRMSVRVVEGVYPLPTADRAEEGGGANLEDEVDPGEEGNQDTRDSGALW